MLKEEIYAQGKLAKRAARILAGLSVTEKDQALLAMAEALIANKDSIIEENKKDLLEGEKNGLSEAMADRLMLDDQRIEAMAGGLRKLVALADPIGKTEVMFKRPNGLEVGKVRVPLGTVGMIYEARPNVTVDAAGICIKTGNAVILRGGSTAIHSNIILSNVIAEAAVQAGLPEGCIQLIQTTDREAVNILFTMNQYLDVLIPRGGAGLIQSVVNNSTVPVIETGTGICHAYVDAEADLQMAVDIVNNGKSQRPSVCNSLETVLVHQDVAEQFYPMLEEAFKEKNVLIRACENSSKFLAKSEPATEEDYRTEYLDYIISGKVVKDIDEAMDHIAEYGTHHSDVIITKSYDQSRKFLAGVDSAAVYVNASTRFTDGEMFGFGAEIGISTQKLHARGPMGLEELTTYKYVIYGSGQIRG
jgi:glutamate-5-semialdehyde dehydrogenase